MTKKTMGRAAEPSSGLLDLGTVLGRFQGVHGDRYDYSELIYTHQHRKIHVVCRVHGRFSVTSVVHWHGAGCPECAAEAFAADFVRRLVAKYGDAYDFSETRYVDFATKVTIICREHGPFELLPPNLLKAGGCKFCAFRRRREGTKATLVERVRQVHGDAFNYGKFVYSDMHLKSTVVCPRHGDYQMSAANHLSGHRCPSCWPNKSSAPELLWAASVAACTGWDVQSGVRIKGVRSPVDMLMHDTSYGTLAIEYDGSYWHSQPKSFERDCLKTARVSAAGVHIVRLRTSLTLPVIPLAVNIYVDPWPTAESTLLMLKTFDEAMQTERR